MRKWTYLVAALLVGGATTTFTGCIDNDEPAGIEQLFGKLKLKRELKSSKQKCSIYRHLLHRLSITIKKL